MVLGHKEEAMYTLLLLNHLQFLQLVQNFHVMLCKAVSEISKEGGFETEMFSDDTNRAHCSFEFTYFAQPSSKMEGTNIYLARKHWSIPCKKIPYT